MVAERGHLSLSNDAGDAHSHAQHPSRPPSSPATSHGSAISGDTAPSLTTLRGLHRAHLLAIPYENLDIHLGRAAVRSTRRMFAKLVDERRGGWCYEMNGLFAHVLETLGFDVRRVSGAVGRAEHGWRAQGNHLVLIVALDRPWIADVGFGEDFSTRSRFSPAPIPSPFCTIVSRVTARAGALTITLLRRGGRVRVQPDGADAGRLRHAMPRAPDISRLGFRQDDRLRALHA